MTRHTFWLYLVLFLFVSYLVPYTIARQGWLVFITFFLKLCLAFSPVVLYAIFRDWKQPKRSSWLNRITWGICFLLYPILLVVIGSSNGIGEWFLSSEKYQLEDIGIAEANEIGYNILLTLAGLVFATEVLLSLNTRLFSKLERSNLLQRFGLNALILMTCGVIAVLLGLTGVVELYERNRVDSLLGLLPYWFGFSVQFFFIILVYYFYFWINQKLLIPNILKQKGVIYYGFSVAGMILVLYPLFIALIRLLPMVETLDIGIYNHTQTFGKDGGGIPFMIMLITVPVVVSTQWFRQNSQIANLEKEKVDAELSFLRQQINPHFYFNTLNNLYALSLTKDQRTPEVILQLSELMRYVIYKGKEKTVLLKEEIKYIDDYTQLQQIRLHKKLDYSFQKNILDENSLIPPLLFINLIENAFKHGIEPATKDCFLHLSLHSDEKQLIFTCENSFEDQKEHQDGTGLKNLRRRLELLFPDRHELITQMGQQVFKAKLIISVSRL
ncbi:MAG: histidine kinase [Bacteroidota bacterium]